MGRCMGMIMLYDPGSSIPIVWCIENETCVHVVPTPPQIAGNAIETKVLQICGTQRCDIGFCLRKL